MTQHLVLKSDFSPYLRDHVYFKERDDMILPSLDSLHCAPALEACHDVQ